MKQYKELLEDVLTNGVRKEDRTGTGTISRFGVQKRYDLRDGFPLVTTKETAFRLIVLELLWFLKGSTDVKELMDQAVNIWNKDAYASYCRKVGEDAVEYRAFVEAIRNDDPAFAEYKDLGPIYGSQWRSFEGGGRVVDQIHEFVEGIKANPDSRRHLVTAWNPGALPDMALPPCHVLFQGYVADRVFSLQLYQRSADVFLGVPFNIASYALLLKLVAKHTGLEEGEFIHTLGDYHLYSDHVDKAMIQLQREERKLPIVRIKTTRENIWDYQLEDFELIGYDPHPKIKAEQSA